MKENCYFFSEFQDMSAKIPTCNLYGYQYEDFSRKCLCCIRFISKEDADVVIKRYVGYRGAENGMD